MEDIALDFPNPSHKRPAFWDDIPGPPPRRPFSNQPQNETLQKIAVGNGIFVQEGFSIRPDYREAVEKVYQSTLHSLDFSRRAAQAMNHMNEYVSPSIVDNYILQYNFMTLQMGHPEDGGQNNKVNRQTFAATNEVDHCECTVFQGPMGEYVH